jgi:ferric-dicitrate binding protein FerR (iron transport regulator)
MDPDIKEKVQLFVAGELEEDKHKEVFDWISSSSLNRRYYNGLYAALRTAEYFGFEKNCDIERVSSGLAKRIELSGEPRKTDFRLLFRIAAALLVLAITHIVLINIREYNSGLSESLLYNTIESPYGSRVQLYLPDSTFVVLNAGSTLRYPGVFMGAGNRKVMLSGEGYFEVVEKDHSAFVVKVGDIEFTAIGTAFNVKAYPEEAQIEATLVEGSLRITRGEDQDGAVLMKPNEKVSIIKKEEGIIRASEGPDAEQGAVSLNQEIIPGREVCIERNINPVADVSWKDREWIIRGKTMEELSVMLERRYNVEIVLDDNRTGSLRFSGILKDETLEQVLFAIRSTAPIDYKIEGNRVLIRENPTLKKQYERLLKENTGP